MTRRAPVYPRALRIAEDDALRLIGRELGEGRARAITRIIATAYVTALTKTGETRRGQRAGPVAKALAAMKVGETIKLPPQTTALYRSQMVARKVMEAPNASWRSDTLPTGELQVRRLPDGAQREPNTPSAVVLRMVEMKVGDSALMPELTKPTSFTSHYKARARYRLGAPQADWKRRSTSKGVRVTRVA